MGDDNSSSTDASNLPLAAPSAVTASSPYYLHPSDKPRSLITVVLLSSDNYTDPDRSRWLAANSMIVRWIRTSIHAKVRSTVMFVPEAHKLWETLRFRFSVKNGTRLHQLQDAINNCRQGGQSVLDYYGKSYKIFVLHDLVLALRLQI